MTLIKRNRGSIADFDPFNAFSTLESFWPSALPEDRGFMPAMDVTETQADYKVHLEAPGMAKDQITVEYEGGILTISGEKKMEHEEKGEKSYRIERRYGAFTRSLRFKDVEAEKIDAGYADGVLTVTVPKSPAAKVKKIDIS